MQVPLFPHGPHAAGTDLQLPLALGGFHSHRLQVGFNLFGRPPIDIHSVVGDLFSEDGGLSADFTAHFLRSFLKNEAVSLTAQFQYRGDRFPAASHKLFQKQISANDVVPETNPGWTLQDTHRIMKYNVNAKGGNPEA